MERYWRKKLVLVASDHPSVAVIDALGYAPVGDDGAEDLSRALGGNTHVTRINLRCHRISHRGVASIANAIRNNANSAVKEIDFGGNPIGDEGALEIAALLSSNVGVKKVSVMRCNISKIGRTAIVRSLANNRTISWVNIAGNSDVDINANVNNANNDGGNGTDTRRTVSDDDDDDADGQRQPQQGIGGEIEFAISMLRRMYNINMLILDASSEQTQIIKAICETNRKLAMLEAASMGLLSDERDDIRRGGMIHKILLPEVLSKIGSVPGSMGVMYTYMKESTDALQGDKKEVGGGGDGGLLPMVVGDRDCMFLPHMAVD